MTDVILGSANHTRYAMFTTKPCQVVYIHIPRYKIAN